MKILKSLRKPFKPLYTIQLLSLLLGVACFGTFSPAKKEQVQLVPVYKHTAFLPVVNGPFIWMISTDPTTVICYETHKFNDYYLRFFEVEQCQNLMEEYLPLFDGYVSR